MVYFREIETAHYYHFHNKKHCEQISHDHNLQTLQRWFAQHVNETKSLYILYVVKGLRLACNVAQQENKEKEPLYSWKKLAHLLEEFQ